MVLSGRPSHNFRSAPIPDDILPFDKTKDAALSRRAFGALSLGVGAAVTTSAMAAGAVVESDIVIKMADGSCGAALFYPLGNGSRPGAVIFTDALGLRSAFHDMGRRQRPKIGEMRPQAVLRCRDIQGAVQHH